MTPPASPLDTPRAHPAPRRWTLVGGVTLALLLSACQPKPASTNAWVGYVEGEYRVLSVPVSGYLKALPVARGARVTSGEVVFELDAALDALALQQSQATTQAAQARSQNLAISRRPAEIEAARAQVAATRTALHLAQSQVQRQQSLSAQQFISPNALEEAQAHERQAQAQHNAALAQLKLAEQPVGRSQEQRAAQLEWQAAQAGQSQRAWLSQQAQGHAPANGVLSEVFRHPGEWVAAGQPVVSVLPDAERWVRVFVPQSQLPQVTPGAWLTLTCEGCPTGLKARVERVADQAEYTPPVVFTPKQSHTLVHRVDARVQGPHLLAPGLPVTVTLIQP